jgi:hypothetical protein
MLQSYQNVSRSRSRARTLVAARKLARLGLRRTIPTLVALIRTLFKITIFVAKWWAIATAALVFYALFMRKH